MASLLRQIQDAATEDSVPVATLLRKCKILASRLNHPAFAEWVDWELDGYPGAALVPPYRRLTGLHVLATLSGPLGRSAQNIQVARAAVDQEDREALYTVVLTQGIAEIDDLLATTTDDNLGSPWPAEAVIKYQDKVLEMMTMVAAHRSLPRMAIAGLLSAVRNRVLAFALEIETENPAAGEAAPGSAPVSAERVSQLFYTVIQGGQPVVQVGGGQIENVTQVIDAPTWERLKTDLQQLGLEESELAELGAAIYADAASIRKGQAGPATEQWIGRIATKVQTGALQVTSDATGSMIAALVLKAIGAS